jgi:hypothetical protein
MTFQQQNKPYRTKLNKHPKSNKTIPEKTEKSTKQIDIDINLKQTTVSSTPQTNLFHYSIQIQQIP